MPTSIPEKVINALIERLADIEHQRWAHWQRYMHDRCRRNPDGSITVPQEYVEQWERQIETPYEGLSEQEKESDRDQVRRYLPQLLETLGIKVNVNQR